MPSSCRPSWGGPSVHWPRQIMEENTYSQPGLLATAGPQKSRMDIPQELGRKDRSRLLGPNVCFSFFFFWFCFLFPFLFSLFPLFSFFLPFSFIVSCLISLILFLPCMSFLLYLSFFPLVFSSLFCSFFMCCLQLERWCCTDILVLMGWNWKWSLWDETGLVPVGWTWIYRKMRGRISAGPAPSSAGEVQQPPRCSPHTPTRANMQLWLLQAKLVQKPSLGFLPYPMLVHTPPSWSGPTHQDKYRCNVAHLYDSENSLGEDRPQRDDPGQTCTSPALQETQYSQFLSLLSLCYCLLAPSCLSLHWLMFLFLPCHDQDFFHCDYRYVLLQTRNDMHLRNFGSAPLDKTLHSSKPQFP